METIDILALWGVTPCALTAYKPSSAVRAMSLPTNVAELAVVPKVSERDDHTWRCASVYGAHRAVIR